MGVRITREEAWEKLQAVELPSHKLMEQPRRRIDSILKQQNHLSDEKFYEAVRATLQKLIAVRNKNEDDLVPGEKNTIKTAIAGLAELSDGLGDLARA